MDDKDIFGKYYSRLAKEGIIKAIICGLIIGFGISFILAFATWFFSAYSKFLFLVALIVGLAAGVGTGILLYYKRFRPTKKSVAERLDAMGLDERLITMLEFEGDTSAIAKCQKQDAKVKLGKIPASSIKLTFAKTLIIVASVITVLGISMVTVNALSGFGAIPDYADIVNPPDEFDNLVFVSYGTEGDGYILGEADQMIDIGGDGTSVLAVANDGWVFIGWDDGSTDQQRQEIGVEADCSFIAIFEEMPDVGSDEGGNPQEQGGEASDQPTQQDPTQRDPDDKGDPPPPDETHKDSSGIWESGNQYKDGKTPYQTEFEDRYRRVIEELLKDENMTPEERAMIEAYFNSLKANAGDYMDDEEPETGN